MYAVANINLEYYKDLLKKSSIALDDNDVILKNKRDKQQQSMTDHLAELRNKLDERQAEYKKYLKGKRELKSLSKQLQKSLKKQIKTKAVILNKHEDWLAIELKALFPSGSVEPKAIAYPIVEKIAFALNKSKNKISVQGYTDNVPIQNGIFPSNWELSAGRAAAIVRLLEQYDINPRRLAAIGYGEMYPVASNDTPEGRLRNRRIVILLALNRDVLHKLKAGMPDYLKPTSGGRMRSKSRDPNVNIKNLKFRLGDDVVPAGATRQRGR